MFQDIPEFPRRTPHWTKAKAWYNKWVNFRMNYPVNIIIHTLKIVRTTFCSDNAPTIRKFPPYENNPAIMIYNYMYIHLSIVACMGGKEYGRDNYASGAHVQRGIR